jgi:hypothetical protein
MRGARSLRATIESPKGQRDTGIAKGTSLCHDDGSQFISLAFRGELETVDIDSSPTFVCQPEGNTGGY